MKRTLFILAFIFILSTAVVGCAPKVSEGTPTPQTKPTPSPEVTAQPTNTQPMKIATLAGPTGMGLIKIIDEPSEIYDVTIYTAPDQIMPKIINNEVDIASVPANMAAVLYNKTNKAIKTLVTNGMGVLYIVENGDTVTELSDLKDKTIYATGQGASPEYILNFILEENDLIVGESVTVDYKAQHAELANMVAAGDINLALLPEPFVSVVTSKNPKVDVKINLDDEWQKIFGEDEGIAMSATVVSTSFLEEHPEAVAQFMKDYKNSIDFVNANPYDASQLIAKHKIVGSAVVAENAIPRCNLTFIEGEASKAILEEYFQILFDSNPKSVGGALPDGGLYYLP